jgi:hypothetical protein
MKKYIKPSDFDGSEKGGSCFLPGNPSLSVSLKGFGHVLPDDGSGVGVE